MKLRRIEKDWTQGSKWSFFIYVLYLHCMLHYTVVILHAWLLHFFAGPCFLLCYNGIVTYCPFAFVFCILVRYSVFTNFPIAFIFRLITLFCIQHCIVRKSSKVIIILLY